MAENSNIVVSVRWDDRALRAGTKSSTRTIASFSKDASRALAKVSQSAADSSKTIAGLASGLSKTLSGGLGSALGTGIVAIAQGLAESTRRTREAREHMAALKSETGITAGEVERIRQAFGGAGQELEQIDAQRVAQIAASAGLSAGEVERLTEKIIRLATLDGLDPAGAAERVIQAHTAAHREIATISETILRQAELRQAGVSEQHMRLAERSEELHEKLEAAKSARDLEKLKAEAARVAAGRQRKRKEGVSHSSILRGIEKEAARLDGEAKIAAHNVEALDREIKEIEKSLKLAGQAGLEFYRSSAEEAERSAEAARREAKAKADARRSARLETELLAATIANDEEAESVLRLAKALAELDDRRDKELISRADAARQAKLLVSQNQRAIEAIAVRMENQLADAILNTRMAEARHAEDVVEQARVRSERTRVEMQRRLDEELRAIQTIDERMADSDDAHRERLLRKREFQVALAEETRKQLELIELQGQRDVERAEREISASRMRERQSEIQQRAELHERAARERAAEVEEAFRSGTTIGNSFIAGLRTVMDGVDFRSTLSAFFSIVSAVVSLVPGGRAASLGFEFLSGIMGFSEGGLARGPGGPTGDRILVRVSDGEFINRASSVQKFGVDFFKSLNEGILDLSTVPGYARGGLVGSGAGASLGARGAPVSIYVQAFDPHSVTEALARLYEPAEYRRGISRQNAKTMALMRRRLGVPRTGR